MPPTICSIWWTMYSASALSVGAAVDVELDFVREVRQDLERLAVGVPGNDLRGCVQNHLRRAIVVAEVQRHCAGVILLELEEIAPVGPAKAIDCLVGIADDAEIRAPDVSSRSRWYWAWFTSWYSSTEIQR